jgi:uncharacterized membrane protein YbhN (UPF0104 family)
MIRQIIGWLILLIIIGGLFLIHAHQHGWKEAILTWGGAAIIAGLLIFALHLIANQ